MQITLSSLQVQWAGCMHKQGLRKTLKPTLMSISSREAKGMLDRSVTVWTLTSFSSCTAQCQVSSAHSTTAKAGLAKSVNLMRQRQTSRVEGQHTGEQPQTALRKQL